MKDFVLTCCSTADRSKQFFEENDIKYVCFHYHIGDKNYSDDLGETISFNEFYKMMEDGATPMTSQVNSEEYKEFFEQFLKEGKDILHISLSSGLSGAFNSANIAKSELEELYPERTIRIIDSLGASSGYGLLVEYANDLRKEGKDLEEVAKWIEDNKLNMHHWFFSTDLTSFKRGGRISSTEALIGNFLGICPLMNVDNEGHLIPRKKIRTKRKVIEELIKTMKEHINDGENYSGKCAISYAGCIDDAEDVKMKIEEIFPNLKGKVVMNSIGTVIGSHTGPGTVAVYFMGDKREN